MNRTARLLAVLAIACSLAGACNKGSSVGAAPGAGKAVEGSDRTVSKGALTQKGGLCNEERTVSNPDPDTPEWVIWRLYQLAQSDDTPANFQAFVQLFPSSRNPRELKEMYWGRIRSTVHKFTTVKPGTPDFVICRSMPVDDGRKYYVVTSDPRQTPPPITVGEVEGKQKIVFLTPF